MKPLLFRWVEENRAALEGNLWLLDATSDLDPTLADYNTNAKQIAPTPTFERVQAFIQEKGIDLAIIDSVADVFGEEIDRHAVRSFIRHLRSCGCTVFLLGHPSREGMRDGRNYSGSTHWNNAVRSRFSFTRLADDKGSELAPDLRLLEMAKSNRSRAKQRLTLKWTSDRLCCR